MKAGDSMDWGGLFEFLEMIKDFVLSLIDGMFQIVSTLGSISQLAGQSAWWMPSAIFSVFIVSVTLIIVLRIVGR